MAGHAGLFSGKWLQWNCGFIAPTHNSLVDIVSYMCCIIFVLYFILSSFYVKVKTMRKWYCQIANKPTGSAGGMTVLEQKIEDVMRKDKSVEPDVLGNSMRGQCKLLDNVFFCSGINTF